MLKGLASLLNSDMIRGISVKEAGLLVHEALVRQVVDPVAGESLASGPKSLREIGRQCGGSPPRCSLRPSGL